MLRGASAEAMAGLSEKLGKSDTLADQAKTGEELFGVVRILRSDAALRRVLTDSSVDPEARTGLAESIFGSAVGDRTMKILADAATRRWTVSGDLCEICPAFTGAVQEEHQRPVFFRCGRIVTRQIQKVIGLEFCLNGLFKFLWRLHRGYGHGFLSGAARER